MTFKEKISAVKNEIGSISKDSKNPFFKSAYFDINKLLSEVEPLIQKNQLILTQPILDGKVTTIIEDVETDDNIHSEMLLPNLSDPQKMGSAITYYRRYTLQSLLGLQSEDDDGNKAVGRVNYGGVIKKLQDCKSVEELQQVYVSLTEDEKRHTVKVKDEMKKKLNGGN